MLEYTKGIKGIRVYEGLSWAEFDFAGNLVGQCKASDMVEAFPADKIDEAARTIRNMNPAPFENVYLRFNELPEGGKSRNFATGETENGVSCYQLTWDMITQSYKRTGNALEGAMIAYAIQKAPIYFITGAESGTGSDGEPVIRNARILAAAKFDAEKGGYIVK